MHKITKILPICSLALLLSGCSEMHFNHHFKQTSFSKPVVIASYAFDGQKLSQIKTDSASIKTDPKTIDTNPEALDITYGQNKTVHQGTSLIAYSSLTNYADKYQQYLNSQEPSQENKAKPTIGRFYDCYKEILNQPNMQDQTIVFVNSRDGSIIGAFIGKKVIVHSGYDIITKLSIDKHDLLAYRSSYETYPVKVLESMSQNKKAPEHNNQKQVKTVDDFTTTNNNKTTIKKKN